MLTLGGEPDVVRTIPPTSAPTAPVSSALDPDNK
jgi:hypothetical protein